MKVLFHKQLTTRTQNFTILHGILIKHEKRCPQKVHWQSRTSKSAVIHDCLTNTAQLKSLILIISFLNLNKSFLLLLLLVTTLLQNMKKGELMIFA